MNTRSHTARPTLFFDADDTLYTLREHPGTSYVRLAGACGVVLEEERIVQRVTEVWGAMEAQYYRRPFAYLTTHSDEQLFWYAFVHRVLEPYCSDTVVRQVFPAIYHYFARSESRKLNEDLVNSLGDLLELGCRVGVFSNCDHRIGTILKDLLPFIHHNDIFTAGRLGCKKPSVMAFDRIAAHYDGPLWYIGNNYDVDVAPSCRAGWQGVLYSSDPPPTEEVYCIQSGEDLVNLVV